MTHLLDVQVSFLQQQYTVIESMGSSKICVEHKGRIQRTLTLQVYQESSTDIARGSFSDKSLCVYYVSHGSI